MKKIIRHIISKALVIILILAFVMAGISGCMYAKDTFFTANNDTIKKSEEKSETERGAEVRAEQEANAKMIKESPIKEVIVNQDNNYYDGLVLDEYSAFDALVAMQSTLGIKDAENEFRVVEKKENHDSTVSYMFKQYYNQLPVINGNISMLVDDKGEISIIRGEYREISNIDTDVKISYDNAIALSENYLKKEGLYSDELSVTGEGPLIYGKDDQDLIWYEVTFSRPFYGSVIPFVTVVIDANSGNVILSRSYENDESVQLITAGQFYYNNYYSYELDRVINGTVGMDKVILDSLKQRDLKTVNRVSDKEIVLEDPDRHILINKYIGYEIIKNDENDEKDDEIHFPNNPVVVEAEENTGNFIASSENSSAIDALYNLQVVFDYFENKFQTRIPIETLNVIVNSQMRKDNASWMGDATSGCIIVDERSNKNAPEFSAYIDIMAHEYTHGITHVVSKLYYMDRNSKDQQKSIYSAMGEGYADIFGALIKAESLNRSITDPMIWYHGESRDIPNAKESESQITDCSKYVMDETECHAGSTLLSYPAFLMATGGIHKDPEKSLTSDELAQAWFFALEQTFLADFFHIRRPMEYYADTHFSPKKIESILDAFDMVGIETDPCFRQRLDTSAILHVYDDKNGLLKNYHLTIRSEFKNEVVWDGDIIDDTDFCIKGIVEPGIYTFGFSDIEDPSQSTGEPFRVIVNDEVPDDLTKYESLGEFHTPIHCDGNEICLVLDVSGSMEGKPLQQTKASAIQFVEYVMEHNPNTMIDIVAFSSDAEIVCQKTRSKKEAINGINSLSYGGSTNIHDAMNTAYELLKASDRTEKAGKTGIPKMIVMSDGLPESGPHDDSGYEGPIVKLADEIKSDNIIIYSLGFFHNLKDEELISSTSLMEQIASEGYHYNVTDVDDLSTIFESMASESSGNNAMVITAACPVDVMVKYNGEILSSEEDLFNTSASFGILTFEGENREKKILRLDKNNQYEIVIKGNGSGKMDYSIRYPDENGEYKDVRRVKNIPIKPTTYISTNASMNDADAKGLLSEPKLYVDEDGDGKFDTEYLLGKNDRYDTFDKKIIAYMAYACIISCAILALFYVLKVIQRIRYRNICVCGNEFDAEYDYCGYCGHKKKDLRYIIWGDIELARPSIFKDITKVVATAALIAITVICWKMYQSTPNTILREFNNGHYDTAVEVYDKGINTDFDENYLNFIFEKNFSIHSLADNLSEIQKDCLTKMNLSYLFDNTMSTNDDPDTSGS